MSAGTASIIILSWNGRDYLPDCLSAVLSQEFSNYEVIVVDNGSTDGSADYVAHHFPNVQLIRNQLNLGFAAGNNIGLHKASGDVLVLLNQDTIVHTGWLQTLVDTFDSDSQIGIVGCKAKFTDGTIQHAGAQINNNGLSIHFDYACPDVGFPDEVRDVDYVIGASLAITQRTLSTIGDLDEGFTPVYYEDADWCYRARQAGFRVVYTPRAVITHKESRMGARGNYLSIAGVHRNRLRFVLKHWPLERLASEFEGAERQWLEGLGEGSEVMIAGIQHAYFFHLLHLNDVVKMRHQALNAPESEADAIAGMLLRLRTVLPLRPARVHAEPAGTAVMPPATPLTDQTGTSHSSSVAGEFASADSKPDSQGSTSDRLAALQELERLAILHEFEFHSNTPVIGPIVNTFRRFWNSISTKWAVRSLIQQQMLFNEGALAMLTMLSEALKEQHTRQQQQEYRLNLRLDYLENRINQEFYDRERLGVVLGQYIQENGREIAELIRQLNIQ